MRCALFLSVLLLSTPAYADMVEVKGDIMNGDVLSDDGKKIEFRDAKGKVHSFDKKSVTYMQIDKSDTGKASVALGKTLKLKAEQVLEAAKNAPANMKRVAEKAPKKTPVVPPVSAPTKAVAISSGATEEASSTSKIEIGERRRLERERIVAGVQSNEGTHDDKYDPHNVYRDEEKKRFGKLD